MKQRKTILFLAAAIAAGAFTTTAHAGADAAALWTKHCATCHGKDGKGQTKVGKDRGARDLTDPKVQATLKKDQMTKAIKEGVKDDKTGKEKMKAFAEKLSDEEVAALVDYVLALKP